MLSFDRHKISVRSRRTKVRMITNDLTESENINSPDVFHYNYGMRHAGIHEKNLIGQALDVQPYPFAKIPGFRQSDTDDPVLPDPGLDDPGRVSKEKTLDGTILRYKA